jgi:hypothetical protein
MFGGVGLCVSNMSEGTSQVAGVVHAIIEADVAAHQQV